MELVLTTKGGFSACVCFVFFILTEDQNKPRKWEDCDEMFIDAAVKQQKKEREKEQKTKLQQDVFTCSLVSRPLYTSSHLFHILHFALLVLQETNEASWQR